MKKHKHKPSLAKSLRSLITDTSQDLEPPSSYQAMVEGLPGISPRTTESRPSLQERSSTLDSSWDVVDDLPLRWATDYVPLAAPGSRLMNSPVSTYALWRNSDQARGSALLAVAVKSAVLLYESPKGERAFRFLKVSRLPCKWTHGALIEKYSRNSTHRSRLVASRSSVRACRTTFPEALQTSAALHVPRRSTYEPRTVACDSARRRS